MDLSNNKLNKNKFELIYNEYHQHLCGFAESYISDKDTVREIVQECFIKLWEVRDSIKDIHKIKSFLFTVVRNLCLNKIRDNKNNEDISILESKEFFDKSVIKNETYRLLHTAMNSLSPRNKEIILLALQGYGNEEISQKLNLKLNTIISSKRDSYKILREKLRKYFYLIHLLIN